MVVMSKVVVGMSGGVDSAVAAYLLQLAGYEVIGLTLRNWVAADGQESRCCEIDDARRVCDTLGIPYYVRNCFSTFQEKVIDPFVDDYLHGRTPNPCVICNRVLKWEEMLSFASSMGAEYVATGHYASLERLENGRYTVKMASHTQKDQTYMLYRLTQEQLAATLMPLGKLSKDEVRSIAEKAGLSVANKPDSQEICFVTDGDYANYIEENTTADIPGEGNFVDEDGKVLGTHKGIIHYTVGQRKGLGIALGAPAYVKRIDADKNEVVLASEDAIYSEKVTCHDVNFLSIPPMETGDKVPAFVKIRYHHKAQKAMLEAVNNNEIIITFDEPVKAATPGQSAVFYDENNYVIGGGIIQ